LETLQKREKVGKNNKNLKFNKKIKLTKKVELSENSPKILKNSTIVVKL